MENYKKLQNKMKISVKNIIFSTVADLRYSSYGKVAELLLINLLKMNHFRRFDDHLDFE